MATFEITTIVEFDENMVNENNHIVLREAWATSWIDELLSCAIMALNVKIMDTTISTDPIDTKEFKDAIIKSYRKDIEILTMMKKTLKVKEVT